MLSQSDWTEDFINWINAKNLLFERYEHLVDLFHSYIIGSPDLFLNPVLEDRDASSIIVRKFSDVLGNCNNISYDEPGEVEAYVILHFLNRYRRFQRVFEYLIKKGFMPTRNDRRIEILDIGTGPAPSLYALSDIYDLLRSFGKERDIESLSNINFNSDYVERSHRFRNWLHHFTEYVNYKSGKYYWDVPYHHGSFYDFNNIELSKPIYRYHQNILNNYLWRTKKLSYDLVIFSNFITTEEVFMNFRDEIHKSVVRLRNRGLFLVVGAAGKNYPLIYDKITEFIESGNYSNYKFKASCRKIGSIDFEDSFDDVFGLKIKEISRSIIERLKYLGIEDEIPGYPEDILSKTIRPDFSRGPKWRVLIFQKRSFIRVRPCPEPPTTP